MCVCSYVCVCVCNVAPGTKELDSKLTILDNGLTQQYA